VSYLLHSLPRVAQVIISEGGLMAMYSWSRMCINTDKQHSADSLSNSL